MEMQLVNVEQRVCISAISICFVFIDKSSG